MTNMHRGAALLIALAWLHGVCGAQQDPYAAVQAAARKGDYQAQRNLAFGYASAPYKGQSKNPLLACAWYTVVLHSGSTLVDVADIGNVKVYCDSLEPRARHAAEAQARVLYRETYRREPKF